MEMRHEVDFCVIGGGLAGMCAAIAAARCGARVALIHDRPVFGGNASSEIRMWICGAHGEYHRETGIVEELKLENRSRNPLGNYSIWDTVLFGMVAAEPNITPLLNCSVFDLEARDGRIHSVTGWQLTTYIRHTVEAKIFADCSGDSILAPLSGAAYRVGREAADEFGESIAPACADARTMGMSCLLQARETATPQPFIPPDWIYRYQTDDDLPRRGHSLQGSQNFWWIETGGMGDSIRDTEKMRDELLKITLGVWDHIKNHGDHQAENWTIEWLGFLPGKRESRRYVGDHILTQQDVEQAGRHFEDAVAYGGWTMDDHFPEGFYHQPAGTIFHPAPSPYAIPYRCLYSRNIGNLMFAGRNISATHTALSSTRVMGTCAVIGQAVGTAAALAVDRGLDPRGVHSQALEELQQTLMSDDCYLPFRKRQATPPTAAAILQASSGDPEVLRNGLDRPIAGADNAFVCPFDGWVEYAFAQPRRVEAVRLVFDSDLRDERAGHMPSLYHGQAEQPGGPPRVTPIPPVMVKAFALEIVDATGNRRTVATEDRNYQRLRRFPVGQEVRSVRFIPHGCWGAPEARLFAFDLS